MNKYRGKERRLLKREHSFLKHVIKNFHRDNDIYEVYGHELPSVERLNELKEEFTKIDNKLNQIIL